jgi:hypothetical protein
VICAGESVTLTASGADTYLWNTGDTTQSIIVSPMSTISYSVVGTDLNGSDNESITITVNSLPVISSGTTSNPSGCGNADGSLQISGSGTGTITWSGTASGTASVTLPYTITGLAAGGYTVDFDNGCPSNSLSYSLSDPGAPNPPVISALGSTSLCDGESTTLESSIAGNLVWSTQETTSTIQVNTGGSYTVTYIDGNGCSATSVPFVVTVNPLPTVSLTTDVITCINYNPSNLAGLPAGGTYSGTGVVGNSFDPSVAGIGTHTLTYEYTDGNGCTNSSSTDITVDGCASLIEANEITATIYPNPMSDQLFIEISGDFDITITDMRGRIVAINSGSDQMILSTSEFENGIYNVNLTSGNFSKNYRIVKH